MTKKERIKAIINGEIPAEIPFFIDLTSKGKSNVAEYYKIDVDSVNEFIGNNLLFVKFTEPEGFVRERVGETIYKDEFGVTWDNGLNNEIGDWGIVDHSIKDMSADGYRFPEPYGKGRFNEAERIIKQNPDNFSLLQMVGLLERSCQIAGMQDILMSMPWIRILLIKCWIQYLNITSVFWNKCLHILMGYVL